MTDDEPIWIEYSVELDALTPETATFYSNLNKVTISMPRGDWMNLGRPTKISSRVQEYRAPIFLLEGETI